MSRNRVLASLGFLVVVVAAGLVVVLVNANKGEDIFLESAASIGPNPFTTESLNPPLGQATTTSTTTGTGLYGGSTNQRVCDPAKLVAFLISHPDKGNAWVGALNSDPTLTWSGGSKVKFSDIAAYVAELTPTFLAFDTRVTNYGYKNGKATPHQSILQKGTAVLVDKQGVPRSRCACGNPLTPPKKVDNPHYKGHKWPGFGDQPPCAGSRCAETTTSSTTSGTTTTTTRVPTTEVLLQKPTTTRRGTTQPTNTTLKTTTTTTTRETTTTMQSTTTTCSPNGCPGKP